MAFIIEIMSQVLSLISTAFSRINCIFKLEEIRMSTHGAAEVAVDALDDGRTFFLKLCKSVKVGSPNSTLLNKGWYFIPLFFI